MCAVFFGLCWFFGTFVVVIAIAADAFIGIFAMRTVFLGLCWFFGTFVIVIAIAADAFIGIFAMCAVSFELRRFWSAFVVVIAIAAGAFACAVTMLAIFFELHWHFGALMTRVAIVALAFGATVTMFAVILLVENRWFFAELHGAAIAAGAFACAVTMGTIGSIIDIWLVIIRDFGRRILTIRAPCDTKRHQSYDACIQKRFFHSLNPDF